MAAKQSAYQDIFATAFQLHVSGFHVIPSGAGDKGKQPLVSWSEYQERAPTDAELENWRDDLRPRLWGIVTNGTVAVLDADGAEARAELEAEIGPPHVVTPRGGGHWYIDTDGHGLPTKAGILPGLDIRGQGGFANIAGSSALGEYCILQLPRADNLIPWGKLPGRILEAGQGRSSTPPQSGEPIREGTRNATLASLAGTLRRRGLSEATIAASLQVINATQCEPPLPEATVARVAASIGRYHPGDSSNAPAFVEHLTDTTNAELLISLYGDRLRYDHRKARWLIWEQHYWLSDATNAVGRCAVEAARTRYKWAVEIEDLELRSRTAKWAVSCENRPRIEACLAVASFLEPIADAGYTWDTDPWLLGCMNGVVDLKIGELRPGRPEDRITMNTGIAFDPDAQCPRWLQYLDEVFGDPELIDWLWRALGYSLSGDTSEQCVFMGYGSGSNGKGTLVGAVRASMGDYAWDAPFSTFELHQRSGIPNDLATLEFRRFVSSSETNDNTRLNEARVKALSGQDPITARFLHREFFSFEPHLKLWLFVNHKPRVTDDSYAFWRRVRLIPFVRQFAGDAVDRNLKGKLRAEAPGILAWLVRGCLEWQQKTLAPMPRSVEAATQAYRAESDVLAGFISDRCVEHPQAAAKAADLYKAYRDWAEAEGIKERDREYLTATAFGRRLGERYDKVRASGGMVYRGITVKGNEVYSFSGSYDGSVGFGGENELLPRTPLRIGENTKTPLNPTLKAGDGQNPTSSEDGAPWAEGSDYDSLPLLGFTTDQVVEIWQAEGSPAIPISQCETMVDLAETLSHAAPPQSHLDAVTSWLRTTLESQRAK